MGELIVVTGPPGAGKSTVAALVVERFEHSALVSGDTFFAFLRNGAITPWLPEAHEQNTVVTHAAASAAGRLAEHCDVVYDGMIGPWFLPAFLTASRATHLHYAVLFPPLDVCLRRVSERTGHGFGDLGATEHMWHEFAKARIDAKHLITDIASPPELAQQIVDRATSARIRYPGGR